MKVLVVCQYYYPEPFRITDICEELVKCGNEVMVITGEPNYPEGYIYSGYENHNHSDEIINGVVVHRCHIIPRKTGPLFRLLNYFSYSHEAIKYVKKMATSNGKKFDVVFTYQLSPIMMAKPAIEYKKIFRVPAVMYCLDLWPESVCVGGVKKGSIVYRFFHAISKRIYKSMDYIFVTSRSFKSYLKKEFFVDDCLIDYLPQYAESLFEHVPNCNADETINLLFAGNIGVAQDVDTIINAASILQAEKIQFHIVGGGTELERLKTKASGLTNVFFYGRCPVEEMPKYYSKADAMLITLKKGSTLNLTLPGKIQSYMAAGKPIIGAIDGETSIIIKEADCGYCGEASNVSDLVENIRLFCNNNNKLQMSINSKKYYEKFFSKKAFFAKLLNLLNAEVEKNKQLDL